MEYDIQIGDINLPAINRALQERDDTKTVFDDADSALHTHFVGTAQAILDETVSALQGYIADPTSTTVQTILDNFQNRQGDLVTATAEQQYNRMKLVSDQLAYAKLWLDAGVGLGPVPPEDPTP